MRSDVGSGSLIQIEMPLELEIAMSSFKKAKKIYFGQQPDLPFVHFGNG